MNQIRYIITLCLLLLLSIQPITAQIDEISPFDFGKMWTFENPPKAWFAEAYNFEPEDSWWDDVRMASLRFATWCSASFISPDGLILTNHHCSRDVALQLQQFGESFESDGFYADSLGHERKSPGLFVEQLVKVADITDELNNILALQGTDSISIENRQEALEELKTRYAQKEEWMGLRLQQVNYYSGGKFSLYGYKRYDDIRLVLIPELDLGFFGGDPDNFTYPRYNLDFTLWRAYDENGKPLNTKDHYFPFNGNGIFQGETVFAVGNPGSTERYRTVAQLQYDRDYRYPHQVKFLSNRLAFLQKQYDQNPSEQLLGIMFNLSNSLKAIEGIVDGLQNDILFNRKVKMEEKIRASTAHPGYWNDLAESYRQLSPHSWAINHLAPSGIRGAVLQLLHQLFDYENAITEGSTALDLQENRNQITEISNIINSGEEKELFNILIGELVEDIYPTDVSIQKLLKGKSIEEYVSWVYKNTAFTNPDSSEKTLNNTTDVSKSNDPLLLASRILIPKYNTAVEAFQSTAPYRRSMEAKIVNEVFKVYGSDLPPDATFTLRIADGIVSGYNYNGTVAPYKTTYYGLYDRYYSNDKNLPWSLPKKWENPDTELLMSPINFVSTIDITGGNSGSPVININKELVGLIFDGNIESLPGNFIFEEKYNRSVSVHAGGILAALKYIYKADRISKEILYKEEHEELMEKE